MKRYLIVFALLVLIVPSITFASWWNPLSWGIFSFLHKKEIVQPVPTPIVSEQTSDDSVVQIAALQQEIEALKLENSTTVEITKTPIPAAAGIKSKPVEIQQNIQVSAPTPTSVIAPVPVVVAPTPEPANTGPQRPYKDGKLNLGEYNPLYVSDYIKNPKASLNKPVKIMSGVVVDFNQGSDNYIEVMDGNNLSSSSTIEFRIENDNDYTKITNALTKYSGVLIYGYGENNVKFNIVGSSGSYESYEPVIVVDALYTCSKIDSCTQNYNLGVKQVFQKK